VVALLPILALQVFHAGDPGTGILFGFRGVGVVAGPFLVRWAMRQDDLRRLFWAIAGSFAVYGLFYGVVPLMPGIWAAGAFVLVAQLGGGAQWTLSTYGLQVIVPDHIRGRVFAFDYGLVTAGIALSATLAGWMADYVGVRAVMMALAGVEVLYSILWSVATRRVRRSLPRSEALAGPEPA
jgi:MFS family permease